ncbi:MAG: molybdopterin-dependent oxidoreductase [Deltaproteobacteria bacterium]|nr:molybdopterin-dependent oxidoreductase [Deltaproteobacteria bacterium]
MALPFRSKTFSSLASLNLIDKVPLPIKHLKEINRVAKEKDAQFLFSDPFSWSKDISNEEDWLGGTDRGPYSGRGIENITALLKGERNELLPEWRIEKHGAKLIVIDPIRTGLASMADIWLQIKPGCDGMLAMSMINEIMCEKLYDKDFVKEWAIGFEDLKDSAKAYKAEKTAESIWLDPDMIKSAARLYSTTRPACIIEGNGLDMQLNVFDNTRAVCILRGLTGNLDKPGGDLIPQPIPVRNIQLKDRLPKEVKPITLEYPLFNEFHETWGNHAQSCVIDAILDEKPYPVKMLVVQSGNPVVTMTDSNRVIRAFENLEFMVVIDLFMTRTAKLADVILPATSSFEKAQLNRAFMRDNPVIIQNQVIDCVADSWPDWKITFELARRLG